MVVAVLVVAHSGGVHDLRDHIRRDGRTPRAFFAGLVSGDGTCSGFEDRQRLAGVTAGHADDLVDRRIVDFDFAVQSALVFHRACDERGEIGWFQRFEFDDDGT